MTAVGKLFVMILALAMLPILVCCEAEPEERAAFSFVCEGVTASIDDDSAPLLARLGEPLRYDESGACAVGEKDKIYQYDHLTIKTYHTGGVDRLMQIKLMDDTYATPEGIRVGDSLDRVREVYGTPDSESDTLLRYDAAGMKLKFTVREGAVTTVTYEKDA